MDYAENLKEMLTTNTPIPPLYNYYKGLSKNTIYLNEDIDENIFDAAIIPLLNMYSDDKVDKITLYLNSPGGMLYNGFALVDIIERLTTPTSIIILGMAASMGGLIAMAGHNNPNVTTYCYPHSVGLIHSGETFLAGNTNAVRDTHKFGERYEKKIKEYILTHSSISDEMYQDIERKEFWMTADDMLKYGIVDKIL